MHPQPLVHNLPQTQRVQNRPILSELGIAKIFSSFFIFLGRGNRRGLVALREQKYRANLNQIGADSQFLQHLIHFSVRIIRQGYFPLHQRPSQQPPSRHRIHSRPLKTVLSLYFPIKNVFLHLLTVDPVQNKTKKCAIPLQKGQNCNPHIIRGFLVKRVLST